MAGPRGAAEVYRATLPLLRSAGPIAAPIPLTEDQARRKLSKGEFLLHGAPLVFDHGAARELMLGLARNLEEAGLVAMSPIRSALEGDRLIPEELLGHVAEGDYPSLAARAEEQALDPASPVDARPIRAQAHPPGLVRGTVASRPRRRRVGEGLLFHLRRPRLSRRTSRQRAGQAPALRAVRRGLAFPPATMYLLRQRGPLPSRHPLPGRPARERPGGGVRQVPWLSQGGCPLCPQLTRRAGGRGPLHPLPGLPRARARLPSPAAPA